LRLNRLRRTILILLLLSAFTTLAAAAELTVELLAETNLPGDLEVDRTRVGGLSGLTYDPGCDLFYAISDDRGSLAPPRFYTLKIRFDGEDVEATVLGATLLRDADGAPFARGDIDPEALALTAGGTLFLASEGVPHRGIDPLVGRFGLGGSLNGTQGLPKHFLPDADGTRGVRDNLGFEGLAVSPDGSRLFAAAENALLQDGPAADLDLGSPTRLLEIELSSGRPVAEYLYEVGSVPDEPRPATAFRTNGISEILALDNERLLVLERSFSVGVGNTVRIYLVNLQGAADIRDIDSLSDMDDPKPAPLAKVLVADIGELGVEPDNIEGMALGPDLDDGRRLLVLISDNNFQPSVQTNQVLLLAVSGVASPVVTRPEAGIHEIQGAGHVSPLVGRCVSRVDGLVTAILGSRTGQAFWIQNQEPGDTDPRTSEGLFVTALEGLTKVGVGDMVRLDGRVEERSWGFELPVTRLVASGLEVLDCQDSSNLPEPVVIGEAGVMIPQPDVASSRLEFFDPAQFAADAFESLEGMLVRVEEPVVVGPTSRYGEIVVLADEGRGAVLRTERGGVRMLEENLNPQRIIIYDRLVAEPPKLKVGDLLAEPVEGVLHYSFGSYKLLNTEPLPDVRGDGLDRQWTSLTGNDSHLTVASFNLENLSAVSNEEKFNRLALIIAENLGAPDIVAVQEVQDDNGPEDDGTVTAARTLEMLVEAIVGAGGPRYETRSIDPENNADGGQPGANIRNAFLFNPARVEFVDREGCPDDSAVGVTGDLSLTCNPGLVEPDNPAFKRNEEGRGGSRKPLAGEFRFAGKSIFLVNLHLRSKGGDDPIFGRRQPRVEGSSPRRTNQAKVVADFVRDVVKNDPGADVVVLGDLNDFENSEALGVLETVGLEDLVNRLPLENRYSYVYLGNSQVLDHVLVTESLTDGVEIEMVHVNSEFPVTDRASDHDPVVVRLSIQ
jgi:endonuclease/exonuclease/phosphatase family metal-dependent hydrolase